MSTEGRLSAVQDALAAAETLYAEAARRLAEAENGAHAARLRADLAEADRLDGEAESLRTTVAAAKGRMDAFTTARAELAQILAREHEEAALAAAEAERDGHLAEMRSAIAEAWPLFDALRVALRRGVAAQRAASLAGQRAWQTSLGLGAPRTGYVKPGDMDRLLERNPVLGDVLNADELRP